jgi:guanosine-3',5'-bis(diphosphate) 3'-pyrophosphohydrolase
MEKKVYNKVLAYATEKHEGQFRKDGVTPFITHPKKVSEILIEFNIFDLVSISAALLHDVLEDTDTTADELKSDLLSIIPDKSIVNDITSLVIKLTNEFSHENHPNLKRAKRKKLERDAFIILNDKQLYLIKLADIISNLGDFDALDLDFALTYIVEELQLIRVLKVDHPLWEKATSLLGKQFKNLALRDEPV